MLCTTPRRFNRRLRDSPGRPADGQACRAIDEFGQGLDDGMALRRGTVIGFNRFVAESTEDCLTV